MTERRGDFRNKDELVLGALSDPRWLWRSPESISRQTSLEQTDVVKVLISNHDLIRR